LIQSTGTSVWCQCSFRRCSSGRFFVVLHSAAVLVRDIVLAKPNYSFEKRQRDLEKKRKQEEKRLRKLAEKKPADGEATVADESPAAAAENPTRD
jgi:hypothetical protein